MSPEINSQEAINFLLSNQDKIVNKYKNLTNRAELIEDSISIVVYNLWKNPRHIKHIKNWSYVAVRHTMINRQRTEKMLMQATEYVEFDGEMLPPLDVIPDETDYEEIIHNNDLVDKRFQRVSKIVSKLSENQQEAISSFLNNNGEYVNELSRSHFNRSIENLRNILTEEKSPKARRQGSGNVGRPLGYSPENNNAGRKPKLNPEEINRLLTSIKTDPKGRMINIYSLSQEFGITPVTIRRIVNKNRQDVSCIKMI